MMRINPAFFGHFSFRYTLLFSFLLISVSTLAANHLKRVDINALDESGNHISKTVLASEENGFWVFEGDILLGEVSPTVNNKSVKSDAIIHSRNSFRWPDGIVYYQFDGDYSERNIQKIITVMRRMESYADIQFMQRSNQENYVSFDDTGGCNSYIGMIGGAQTLSLAKNCFSDRVIEHELLHALGFWHEQSRSDRDDFVDIIRENIEEGKEHNFEQHINNGIDVCDYDYLSVMHYSRTTFSGNGEPTIVRKGDYNGRLGGNRMSDDDVTALQSMYGELSQNDGEVRYSKSIDYVPSATNTIQQGFIRLRNNQGTVVNAYISGYDNAGNQGNDVIHFSLGPYASKQLNSNDLEYGNPSKDLYGAFGSGAGAWRITVHADNDIDIAGYIRTSDGFMTQIDATTESTHGRLHEVPIFNPASNGNQVSKLRLINLSASTNFFNIRGIDDKGISSRSEASIEVAPRQTITLTAQDLEYGNQSIGLEGAIGSGSGKWYLEVNSMRASRVMNLLEAPGGYLSNLSNSVKHAAISSLLTCNDIDGARIYGSKGNQEYLGFFGSEDASDSVLNYASDFADAGNENSILNPSGTYGSVQSDYSHTNSRASSPPVVVKNGKALFYLSTNNSMVGTISYDNITDSCILNDAKAASAFDMSF